MKVRECNFATLKSIKTTINMKKILSLILLMMTFASHAMAETPTTSTSSSQSILLEISQLNNDNTGRHRTPMRINIEAWYNTETNSIDILYDGEAEGEVFLYLNGAVVEYDSKINTSLEIPSNSGFYKIEIIGNCWTASGSIQL